MRWEAATNRRRAPVTLAALFLLGGCATYLAEKADLEAGGAAGSKRVADAQERLQLAQDRQASLQEDELGAREEREALEDELAAVNSNLKRQSDRLAAAQAAGKISEAQEWERKRKLEELTSDFQTASQQLQLRSSAGDDAGVREKEQELTKLKAEIDALNKEIAILAQ
jgi:septal ring factor EnvC (AmiA/AmiB activator)